MKGCLSSTVVWLFVSLLPFAFAPPAQSQGISGVCVAFCDDPPTVYDPPPREPERRYTTPRGVGWYCKATASNGGWGWGEHRSKSTAASIAVEECGTRGRGCSISYCSLNGGARRAPQANTKSRARKSRRGKVSADLCYRKLMADAGAGRFSARRKTYISQALAGYSNCKAKSYGSTRKGDNYARKLRNEMARVRAAPGRKNRAAGSKVHKTPTKKAISKTSARTKQSIKRERERSARLAKAARLKRKRAELAAAPGRVAAAVKRGDYKAALADQALVLAANKNNPGAWRDFSIYLEKSGRLDDAATAIRRAALLAGEDPSAAIAMMYQRDAKANVEKGNFKKAISQQAMAIEAKNDDPLLWQALGDYMEKDGQLDNAATMLRRANILGGPDPEDQIFQMYQTDVLARARSLNGEEKLALYRSNIKKYAGARSNPVRHRLARELLKQKRPGEARKVYQRIVNLDPRDNAALAALGSSGTGVGAEATTFSQLEQMRRDMETASVDLGSATASQKRSEPQSISREGKLSTDIDALAGSLTDALQQIEALKTSIDQDQTPQAASPGNTFEVVVPTDKPEQKPKPSLPDIKQASKQNRPASDAGDPQSPPEAARLTSRQKQQQLKASRGQRNASLFHLDQARSALARFKATDDPTMKRFYLKEAEASYRRAQAMAGKFKRTMGGQAALDAQASANALNGEPIKFGEGVAIGQARRLIGQSANGNKSTAPNLIDGSEGLRTAPSPGGVKPKTQGLLGTKRSPE